MPGPLRGLPLRRSTTIDETTPTWDNTYDVRPRGVTQQRWHFTVWEILPEPAAAGDP